MWGNLTHEEVDYCKSIMAEFRKDNFQVSLVTQIEAMGFGNGAMPNLFELRYAKTLKDRKINAEYEVKTLDDTTVDFVYSSPKGKKVFCELVSIGVSKPVEDATIKEIDKEGIEWFGFNLSSNNANDRFTEEAEILLIQQKICTKVVTNAGKPIKFPPLDKTTADFHVIAVDMRGFLGGNGGDKGDYIQLTYGNDVVARVAGKNGGFYKRFWTNPKTQVRGPILGLFEDGSKQPRGVNILKERVHGILFLNDKAYKNGSLIKSSFLAHNPFLIDENK